MGNAKFANSIRQAPRFAEPGEKGQSRTIKLEIKLLADVGLIGLPNVGKSSILSIVSDAKPKIANYHFTTLEPNLGVVRIGPEESFVVADIPGLIEGASMGLGLGYDFLKHIERTKVLVHVLDISSSEGRDAIEDYLTIRKELLSYNKKIEKKKEIIVLNKIDIPTSKLGIKRFEERFPDKVSNILLVSAATTEGIDNLKFKIWEKLKTVEKSYETYDEVYESFEEEKQPDYEIKILDDKYIVTGPLIDDLVYRINFQDNEALKHFQKVLEDKNIISKLKEMGIQDGDAVVVGGKEFEYFN